VRLKKWHCIVKGLWWLGRSEIYIKLKYIKKAICCVRIEADEDVGLRFKGE